MALWERVRHRRLQALSLVLLAALLTTSLGLGPLYQRAMEQALTGSVLADATPQQRALRLTAQRDPEALEERLPPALAGHVEAPLVSRTVDVELVGSQRPLTTRLYAVDAVCERLVLVEGACPAAAGEVAVSDRDVEVNGWVVGSEVAFTQPLDDQPPEDRPRGGLRVVGVYDADAADAVASGWVDAPITGRAGREIDGLGLVTDDWVTTQDSFDGVPVASPPLTDVVSSVVWPLDLESVDADDVAAIGRAVARLQTNAAQADGVRADSSLGALADRVETGRAQGRVTVAVLVAQLLVLVAVVLWMVLCAATDDRRPELALARLRGQGRGGAMRFLLVELVPIGVAGVVLGALVAPGVMAVVSRVVFPVPVPVELPPGFALAVLGALVAVLLVVLAAVRRAVREPVDSLLRAVPGRRGSTLGEVVAVVFSLTAVVALLTGTLEGPLATLAPTLLAVAAGLLLGRALGPVTSTLSRRLLRRGRAVAAAGIVTAVRRPSARRVLVMVVVAGSLVVFCADALVTGQQNRQAAAEQDVGAPYALSVQSGSLRAVTDAVAAADPEREHATTVVTTAAGTDGLGPTVAVDPVAFARVAHLPGPLDVGAIEAPQVTPVRLTGTRLTGSVVVSEIGFGGPSERLDEARVRAVVQRADGVTVSVDLATLPRDPATIPVDAALECTEACVLTGLTLLTPPGLEVNGDDHAERPGRGRRAARPRVGADLGRGGGGRRAAAHRGRRRRAHGRGQDRRGAAAGAAERLGARPGPGSGHHARAAALRRAGHRGAGRDDPGRCPVAGPGGGTRGPAGRRGRAPAARRDQHRERPGRGVDRHR